MRRRQLIRAVKEGMPAIPRRSPRLWIEHVSPGNADCAANLPERGTLSDATRQPAGNLQGSRGMLVPPAVDRNPWPHPKGERHGVARPALGCVTLSWHASRNHKSVVESLLT